MNKKLAKIFFEIANYLEIEEQPFKPEAYKRASVFLENMDRNIEDIYIKGGIKALEDLPIIGKSIAEKIEEYIKTGKIRYYENYRKRIPVDFGELTRVEGVGAKTVQTLWKTLKIKNISDLEKNASEGKIRNLAGFGEKKERNILQAIQFLKKDKGRILLGDIISTVEEIKKKLKTLKEVKKIEICGSYRRKQETIGDIDILIAADNYEKVMDFFISMSCVEKVWGKGPTKSSVRIKEGINADLRIVPLEEYGSALQYFTGSKEHNISLRNLAIKKGMKLNEYGLFEKDEVIASKTEEEIYSALGISFIPPEIRLNTGEIKAALEGKLPKLIEMSNIKGDLHNHTNWNGGINTIEELIKEAEKIGYEYLGISDHSKFLKIEHGLNEEQLLFQKKEIEKIRKKFSFFPERKKPFEIKILHGVEANILNNGSLDISDDVLSQLDYVTAGVHSSLKMGKEAMTERIIKAIRNPYVNIISHPTGRIINRREEYKVDLDRIFEEAKKQKVALEINSSPKRLDLNDENIRKAKERGVMMIIGSDSHNKKELKNLELGVFQSRRGWAEKKDILNTKSFERLMEFLKGKP